MRAVVAAAAAATLLLVLALAPAPANGQAATPAGPAPSATTRLIVAFDPTTTAGQRRDAHRRAGARAVGSAPLIGADVVEVADAGAAAAALARYQDRPGVRFAEADSTVHALAPPNDPRWAEQWNLQAAGPANPASLNWEPLWPPTRPLGTGVTVAVIDSGFRPNMEDAPVNVDMEAGVDYVDGGLPVDENGHGTHVTGTIAQRTDNGKGVAGVAPQARVIPVRVLDADGSGPVSRAIRGLEYAVSRGATVINLSFGGSYSRAFCEAVSAASQQAVVVAAAGNDSTAAGWLPVAWPAACPGALAVGALARDASRAPYGNAGCTLALSAPGGHPDQRRPDGKPYAILQQTFNQAGPGYFYESGTSMAAAHVSGAAAVLLSQSPPPSVATVRRVLAATARDVGPPGADPATGAGAADVQAALSALNGPVAPPPPRTGYWQVASDGGIFAFGDAPFLGSTGGLKLNSPIVAMAATPSGRGYWLVAADGGVFAFGDAPFLGSTGHLRLNRPIVAMAPSATGRGYWLTASDGGIFAFGDAAFFGSAGSLPLKAAVVGIRPTPTGDGYWLVATDGGIFAFGAATYQGSTGGLVLNKPVVAMAPTLTGEGYWLTATDGGIFAFGDAAFRGSAGAIALNSPIVAMATTCRGGGYWLAAADGGVFAFGDAPFLGSTGAMALNRPIVGMAVAVDQR